MDVIARAQVKPRRSFPVIRFVPVVFQVKQVIFSLPVKRDEIRCPTIIWLKEERHVGIVPYCTGA
jgi:hypothetical protein